MKLLNHTVWADKRRTSLLNAELICGTRCCWMWYGGFEGRLGRVLRAQRFLAYMASLWPLLGIFFPLHQSECPIVAIKSHGSVPLYCQVPQCKGKYKVCWQNSYSASRAISWTAILCLAPDNGPWRADKTPKQISPSWILPVSDTVCWIKWTFFGLGQNALM